jgi:hypothetical protein
MKYTLLLIIIAVLVICWVVYNFVSGKKKAKVEGPKAPTPPATPPAA